MTKFYSNEKTAQVVVALLKEHGIRKVIASPGTTNMSFVGSVQNDPYFEVYSSVDERSAAYLACGMAAESGEPVVISCTGATASRNYMSGLTEAFYRKLPVLAITATKDISSVGHHMAQVIDRSALPNDVVRHSVTLPIIKDNDDDLWDCEIKTNRAILELVRHGGGPVHINLPTTYNPSFGTKELPKVRVIDRITPTGEFPVMPKGKVAVFIGAHTAMSKEETDAIDSFCASNNAVVFCDHTSGYKGKFRVLFALVASQRMLDLSPYQPDVLIHIGEITGDYYSIGMRGNQVWRVSEDGEIRDLYHKLRYVFEMTEKTFFGHYSQNDNAEQSSYFQTCKEKLGEIRGKLRDMPFSNIWIASKLAHRIPEGSVVHLGILNSLRAWNFFELPESVTSASNVGGFGIDGGVSSLIGASLSDKKKLYFGVIGDLAFFYDMNVIGNRHVGKNVRILLVNNGKGTEFRNFSHPGARFGNDADKYIAAGGHFGNKSKTLVKNYSQNLGFEYLTASNKQEFEEVYERFLTAEVTERPILFEVFTDDAKESDALSAITAIETSKKSEAKQFVKHLLGEKGVSALKKTLGR